MLASPAKGLWCVQRWRRGRDPRRPRSDEPLRVERRELVGKPDRVLVLIVLDDALVRHSRNVTVIEVHVDRPAVLLRNVGEASLVAFQQSDLVGQIRERRRVPVSLEAVDRVPAALAFLRIGQRTA